MNGTARAIRSLVAIQTSGVDDFTVGGDLIKQVCSDRTVYQPRLVKVRIPNASAERPVLRLEHR